MEISEINKLITELSEEERNNVSDWYHTFCELYEHRCVLYIALVNLSNYVTSISPFKKSKTHADWTSRDGYFIVQWYIKYQQISYHLPMKYRDNVRCETVVIADKRDWHNSQDVLDRLLLV